MGKMVPLVFALLPDKQNTTYVEFIQAVKTNAPAWNPGVVQIDFEQAAKNAFEEVFPDVLVKGCLFHFTQALWRKIQALEMTTVYKNNDKVTSTKLTLKSHPISMVVYA